ncbi:MAG: nucleoside triphosphate pyrophosphohydrolase [Candidatus Aenigmarchaeota archaeon]|nr:nucleoside triphosphate pyrophosphohydrolase [Candidatus Aenigmarchaeota archaeon]
MKKPKLVRDKIPELIEKDSLLPIFHIADDEEYWQKLKEKLLEEVNEFIEEENVEELADILEVINAICEFLKVDISHLESIRKRKRVERGGFEKRIVLKEVRKV